MGDRIEADIKQLKENHLRCVWVFNFCLDLCSRAKCSSMVRVFAHGAMCRRIAPSWGGPIELFPVPSSAPPQRPWYVLSCLWDDAYKRTLAANR